MSDSHVMFISAFAGLIVFFVLLHLALGPLLPSPPQWVISLASVFWNLHSQPEKPWVRRARMALARLPSRPRNSGELEGWSWRAVEGDPVMTVRIEEHASDGRRVTGYVTGTPGTLAVVCRARTGFKLVSGWITLTPEGGSPMTLKAGDSLILHPGFCGSWQNETVASLTVDVDL